MLEDREETRPDWQAGELDHVRGEDRLDTWQAIKRHPILFILPILVFVGAGIALALHKKPKYTAQTRVGIIRVNVTAPGALAGFATAGEALAETYSRAIKADGVIQPLAQQFKLKDSTVRTRLDAAAIPSTPVLRVSATAPTKDAAIKLANAADDALVNFVISVNHTNVDATRLFSSIRRWELNLARLQAAERARKRELEADKTSALKSNRLQEAQAQVAAATDHLSALRSSYRVALGSSASTNLLNVLDRAENAQSNRRSRMQLYGFAGLVIGGVLGLLFALSREAWLRRKRRRAAIG